MLNKKTEIIHHHDALRNTRKLILFIKFYLVINLFLGSATAFENYHSQFRSSLSPASLLHGTSSNPALLSSPGYPTFGLQLPLPASLVLQISNSTLTLPNPIDFFLNIGHIDRWIARTLIESFGLEGLSPGEVSSRITTFSNRDIQLWMYAELPYLKVAKKDTSQSGHGWGVDISSYIDGYINVPGQIFSLVFSTDKGLQPGNLISFETLSTATEFITEIQSAWAGMRDISFVLWNHEIFDRAQFGFGLTQRFGHAYYSLVADTLFIDYKKRGVMNVMGDITIESSGFKDDGSIDKLSVNGYGVEFSSGVAFQNNFFSLSGGFSNLGLMGWYKKNHSTAVHVAKDSVFLYDLFNGINDTLITTTSDKPDKLRYGLSPVFSGLASVRIPVIKKYHAISTYHLLSLGYQASSTHIGKFGRGFVLSLDIENGIDYGKIPFRLGWTYAQNKNISSTISIELVNRLLTYDIWYRAVGDWLFRSKKGAEIGLYFHVYMGFKAPKNDAEKQTDLF